MNILELNAFEDYDKVDIDMRACIGDNTGINEKQRDESIYSGFKSVVNCIYKNTKNHKLIIDEVIYPYLYCCRHAIELILKQNIKYILGLYDIKKIKYEKEKCLSEHDIKELVECLIRISKIDKRLYEPLKAHEDNINALLSELYIDEKGDTFKYTFSLKDEVHFENKRIVAMNIIQHKFICVTDILDYVTRLVYELISEYKIGTYTNNLSRSDIEDIAKELPFIEEFSTQKFDEVKKKIIDKYCISNREFSNAVNIIKQHREFSQYIGNELKFGDLEEEDFKNLVSAMNLYSQSDRNIKSNEMGVIEFKEIEYKREINPAYEFATRISKDKLKIFMSFIEISMNGYYSEELDNLYNKVKDIYVRDDYMINKCCYNSYKKLMKGFSKCGQLTYAKWLYQYYNIEKEEIN